MCEHERGEGDRLIRGGVNHQQNREKLVWSGDLPLGLKIIFENVLQNKSCQDM